MNKMLSSLLSVCSTLRNATGGVILPGNKFDYTQVCHNNSIPPNRFISLMTTPFQKGILFGTGKEQIFGVDL